MKKFISLLLAAVMLFVMLPLAPTVSAANNTARQVYQQTGGYLEELCRTTAPGVGSIGGEWVVLGLVRSGRDVPAGYYENVVTYVRENIGDHERLHRSKSTDNSRVILALTAAGYDVADVDGHNLLAGIADMTYVQKQGINGPIWALIALDCGDYEIPTNTGTGAQVTREALIDVILADQLADGGWTLSGETADSDMTGMAVQALAPYYETNSAVKAALDAAITCMSAMQDDDGGYSTGGDPTSESTAQIIVALTALDIDPDTDSRFIKNGYSAVDALCTYAVEGGGFEHTAGNGLDGMATEQGYYALTAYFRYVNGQTFLYDMSDVKQPPDPCANGHTPVADMAVAATCTATGLTEGTHCSVCNTVLVAQQTIAATGHSWDDGKVTKEATETSTGIMTYTCTACGETRTETIPMLEHTHAYTATVTAPTCTAGGYTAYTCSCGDSYTSNATDALGHSWDNGTVTEEATETSTGIMTYTCTACGETRTETIPQLNHTHSYTSTETAPTCMVDGYTAYTCSCGDTYSERIPATGHNMQDGVCTVCGSGNVTRIYGDTRYETAFRIADALKKELGVARFDTIIVASGTNFPDALSGSYLAAVEKAPILLTNGTNGEDVKAYIEQNLADNGTVYILGGTAAVSQSVERLLSGTGANVERLAGDSRYLTNLEILEAAGVSRNQQILICSGINFPDALSASATGLPILLVGAELTAEQADFLERTSGNFVIIGGTSAVSDDVAAALGRIGNVQRVSGDSRYETSVEVAEQFFDAPAAALLACGRNFPDGLCGGPLACAMGVPLLLTERGKEANAADYCAKYRIREGAALGGPAVLSDDSVGMIFA